MPPIAVIPIATMMAYKSTSETSSNNPTPITPPRGKILGNKYQVSRTSMERSLRALSTVSHLGR